MHGVAIVTARVASDQWEDVVFRAVCYKYTKQWEHMATDARESCTLEPDVPENYLRCAVALKQLGRTTELKAVCTTAEALDMPDKLRSQLATLMAP